jgi:hypothetical protein
MLSRARHEDVRGVDVYLQLLTWARGGGDWSASRHGRFTSAERGRSTYFIGGWADPRARL